MKSETPSRSQSPSLLSRISLFFTPRLWLRVQVGLAAALGVGLFLAALAFSTWLDPLQIMLSNWIYKSHPPSNTVVIIAIDDKSITELGAWPWPRANYVLLLSQLKTTPPRVIAFNLVFSQPTADDTLFAARIHDAGNVLLAATGVRAAALPLQTKVLPLYDVVIQPDQALRQNSTLVGHRMIFADSDGVVRRVPVAIESGGQKYFALSVLAAARYLNAPTPTINLAQRKFTLNKINISTDEHGRIWLNPVGGPRTIPTFSFSDVVRGRVPPETFRDKLVFVGLTGEAESDLFATPLTPNIENEPNVDLQAQLADMWVSNPPRTLEPMDQLALIAAILAMALLAGFTLPHVRPLSAVALTAIFLILYLLYSFDLFENGLLPNLLFPPLALALTFITIVVFRYIGEGRRRDQLFILFRRYLPKDSANRVVEGIERGQIALDGIQRTVTLLYADFRGLGDLVESTSPRTVLDLASEYMSLTARAIINEGGTISKPLGDSLIALWNAPLEQPDHVAHALQAAMEIRRTLNTLKKKGSDAQSLSVSMAITTSAVVLGNIKTGDQVEYTLVGNAVDTAARLCSFAGAQQILIDENTATRAPQDIELRELSPVRVRGRKEPLPVWEVRKTGEIVMGEDEEK